MKTHYEVRYASNPVDVKAYDTQRLRQDFLVEGLFQDDEVKWVYSHYDRYMAGAAVPVNETLSLETIDPLKSEFFLERRELGIINIGGKGSVQVGNESFQIDHKEALYIGKGVEEVQFSSENPAEPARFYINSAIAHQSFPTRHISRDQAEVVELGSLETSNARTIRKLIVNSIVQSNQLQMGMTELKTGSVWNTMPAHTHDRRMEIYLYFEVPEGQAVSHFMGTPQETRHIWLKNEDAVISPPWSIHCGAGTSNYSFIWGMAGENLDYGDMDGCDPDEMR